MVDFVISSFCEEDEGDDAKDAEIGDGAAHMLFSQ